LKLKHPWQFLDYDGMAGDYGPFITATESGVAVIYQDATGAAVGIGLNANTGEVRWSKAQPFPLPYVHSFMGEAGLILRFSDEGRLWHLTYTTVIKCVVGS